MKSSVMLGCLLGSTALFAAPTLTVTYNDLSVGDCSPKLSWDGEAAVTVERALAGSGEWETLASGVTGGSYVDEDGKVGWKYDYRLVEGTEAGELVSFVRLRRISTSAASFFSNGTPYQGRTVEHAFDGDPGYDLVTGEEDKNKICEMNSLEGCKIGVDFGSPSVVVSWIRLFPRYKYASRMNGVGLYGSAMDGAACKNAGTSGDMKLTESLEVSDNGNRWYDLVVADPKPYRSYYVTEFAANATVGEIELYGWLTSDLPSDPDADIGLKVARSDWENAYAVITWNPAVADEVLIQRADAEGEFADLAEATGGLFRDETAPFGKVVRYRLVVDGEPTEPVEFLRMHRLAVTNDMVFWQGDKYWGADGLAAFDGNTATFPDINCTPTKLGVDFGSETYCVAFVRAISRKDGCAYRFDGVTLYGSTKSGAMEKATDVVGDVVVGPLYRPESSGEYLWTEATVQNPGYYRSYYFTKAEGEFYGNIAEVEFYGWTKKEADGREDLTFELSRSDWENSYAVLSWDSDRAGDSVTVQRMIGEGEWEDLATVSDATYTDMTMPYGKTIQYRIVTPNDVSAAESFTRMHRLTVEGGRVFSNATSYWNNQKEDRAFDGVWEVESGDCMSYPDITEPNRPKVGVDFGVPMNFVAMARLYPRTQSAQYNLMNDAVIYGSNRSASLESSDEDLGVQVTVKAGGVSEARWYELPAMVRAEDVKAYRTYYYYHVTGGCLNECEFYGWTRADLGETIPLDLMVVRNNLDEYYPVVTWNDIAQGGYELQRRDAESGGWSTIATFAHGDELTYVDRKARYGIPYQYRLKYGSETSEEVSFRRLRKLTADLGTVFTNAEAHYGEEADHGACAAFDGIIAGHVYVDVYREDDKAPKVGIDFGKKEFALGLIRVYPRDDGAAGNTKISSGLVVYGSDKDAETISETTSNDGVKALTEPTSFQAGEFVWQERASTDANYYRSFYYNGPWRASVNEVELYGWFKSDVIRPFVFVIR